MTSLALIAALFLLAFGLAAFWLGAHVYQCGTQQQTVKLAVPNPFRGEKSLVVGGEDDLTKPIERTHV